MVDITPNDSSVEEVGLLTRLGDANVCSEIPYTTPSSFLAVTTATQDLRDYFGRPRIIGTGSISNLGRFTSGNVFSDLSAYFPNANVRLAGAYGLRFTLQLTIQVSATPFHQGLLALAWQYGSVVDSSTEYDRTSEPFSITQLPHVRMNLQKETSMTLSVPFLSSLDYLPIRGDFSGLVYGHFAGSSILATPTLPSTGAPTYKVYMSLHDIELLGATSWTDNSILIQSGLSDQITRTVKRLSQADAELRRSKALSSTLSTVGAALNTMGSIPLLSSLTGTPAWLANSLAKTAAAFGYAAPAMEESYQRKLDNRTLDVTHIDVPIAAAKLSPFQSNKLEISEAMGATAEDAMSMSYVLSKPSQLFRGSVSTSQTVTTVVYATKISPMSFWFKAPSAIVSGQGNVPLPFSSTLTTNAVYPTTLLYLADSFRYWRGSLRFKFTFAKTAFHGGHLLACFIPYNEQAANTGISNVGRIPENFAGAPQTNAYSATFDMRAADEFEFEVPYIADAPFRGVNDSIGTLSLTVLNPVVTTSAEVSATISFIVEVSAGEDFEFSTYVPSSLARINATAGVVELQSGIEFQSGVSASNVALPYAVEPTATVIGEKFNSLKQLAMIPTFYSVDANNLAVTDVTIPPWNYSPTWTLATPMAANISRSFAFSNCGKVASMYIFSNGSTRYSLLPNAESLNGLSLNILHKANNGNLAGAFYSGVVNPRNKRLYQNSSCLLYSPATQVVDIPFYPTVQRVTHAQCNSDMNPRNIAITGSYNNINYATYSVPYASVRNVSGALTQLVNSYAAGEDATCVAYIGPPPVILFNGLSTTGPNALTQFVET